MSLQAELDKLRLRPHPKTLRRVLMREETEQNLRRNWFEKKTGIIDGSIFIYYKRDAVSI